MDPDDFREPVLLSALQPCRELTVAEVGFVFHGHSMGVVFGFRKDDTLRRVGLTSVCFITTIKAPAFEGRGYNISY